MAFTLTPTPADAAHLFRTPRYYGGGLIRPLLVRDAPPHPAGPIAFKANRSETIDHGRLCLSRPIAASVGRVWSVIVGIMPEQQSDNTLTPECAHAMLRLTLWGDVAHANRSVIVMAKA